MGFFTIAPFQIYNEIKWIWNYDGQKLLEWSNLEYFWLQENAFSCKLRGVSSANSLKRFEVFIKADRTFYNFFALNCQNSQRKLRLIILFILGWQAIERSQDCGLYPHQRADSSPHWDFDCFGSTGKTPDKLFLLVKTHVCTYIQA